MDHKFRIITATTLCILFSAMPVLLASVSALTVTTAVNLSNDTYKASYPDVLNVGNNVYVVWSEGAHGDWFRVSSDGGGTWSTALRLIAGTTSAPWIAASGTYGYVVWTEAGVTYVAISSNSGSSFGTPIAVSGKVTSCETPVIAAYGNDVYVAADCGGHSYVTVSSNNGGTWTTPFLYASGPEPQIAAWGTDAYAIADSSSRATTAIAVSTNNGASWLKSGSSGGSEPWISAYGTNVVAAWETKGSASVVRVITSTDSGKTFSKPFEISSAVPNSWAPMTGIFGNTEYVAWRSHPGSSLSQEYVSVSLNAGGTWSSASVIGISGHDNSWPVTVASTSSSAFIAWYERTGSTSTAPWQAVIVEGTNNGSSWTTPTRLGGSIAETDVATAAVSAFGSTAFAVWTNTTSSGNTQVYFSSGA
jgi:hypothetical protein